MYRSRVLLHTVTVPPLVKKFPALCETKRFITMFTTIRVWILIWAS
jgi:hypothetical protein